MVLPETVRLDQIPASFGGQRNLHYGMVNNRIVLAELSSRKIVHVLNP
ncbi:DUF1236 domain-containing protein [Alsobacter sp. KACC 23698]